MRSIRTGFILIIALIALVASAKSMLYDTMDPDCFWHLRVAQQLQRDGIGPLVDELSFASPREPWTPYSWLAELAMKGIWDVGGYRGAVLVHAILQGTFIVLVALCCRELQRQGDKEERGSELNVVVGCVFAAFLSLPYLSFRPATMSLMLLALCAYLLLRDRRLGERSVTVWCVVPLTALLANIHLFAVAMPVWAGALFIGALFERRKQIRCGVLLGLCLLASMATPMLPGTIRTALHYVAVDPMVNSSFIAELQPVWRGPVGAAITGVIVLLAACAAWRYRRLRMGEWIWFAMSLPVLLGGGKYAPLFTIIASPVMATVMPRLSARPLGRPAVQVLFGIALVLMAARLALGFPRSTMDFNNWLNRHGPEVMGYPCEAAAFVDDHITPVTGRLINEFNWGGYLAWRLGDKFKVLLDGRTQVYPPVFWDITYGKDEKARTWFLNSLDADAAVLPTGKSRFRNALAKLGWKRQYGDERAEVWTPHTPIRLPVQGRSPTSSPQTGQ